MDACAVSVRPCPSYAPETVEEALAALLADLGGAGSFAGPGRTVVLKPNLLAAEEPARAVTTHPEVVRAVAAAMRSTGARVVVGDSPGFGTCRGVAEKTGVAAAARAAGGELGRFDRAVNLGGGGERRFPVAEEIAGADLVVNLPKLKTHGMMVLSGAVKNLFGCVVGLRKPGYHFECRSASEFAALLLDLAAAVAPGLTVMDAIVAMEGPGPRHGTPRLMGYLLGARDPLALDFVAAELAGIPPRDVPHLRLAEERGMAAADPGRRRIVGAGLPIPRPAAFVLPREYRSHHFFVPPALAPLARRLLGARPTVTSLCTVCGICASVCPARALRRENRRMVVDERRCIRCYCCHEMCPRGAVVLRQGLVGRLWPGG